MSKNIKTVLQSIVTTGVIMFSFTFAQASMPAANDFGFFGNMSIKVYCTFATITGDDTTSCKTDIVVTDESPKLATATSEVGRAITKAFSQAQNGATHVVYVQGEKGQDGKDGVTKIVYETKIGGQSIGPVGYFNSGVYQSNPSYQTTVPGDIYSTFVHFLTFEIAKGNSLIVGSIDASSTNTTNLTFGNATGTNLFSTNASLTNSTSTNIYSLLANFVNLFFTNASGTNATITNATSTNFVTTNASTSFFLATNATVTNSTSTNIFSVNASITNATITNLFVQLLTVFDLFFTNASGTNATITNATTTNFVSTGNFSLATGTIASTTVNSANVRQLFGDFATLTNSTSTNFWSLIGKIVNFNSTNATITNATTTNIFAQNASLTNATSTYFFTNYASSVNSTSTNIYSLLANFVNLFFTNASGTNATSTNIVSVNSTTTNLFAINASTTNSTSTNLFASRASITNGTSTTWFSLFETITNLLAARATFTNATSTNLSVNTITGDGTNPLTIGTLSNNRISFITGGIEQMRIRNTNNGGEVVVFSDLDVQGNATFTDATSSNSFFARKASITNATTTNLFAALANFLNLFVGNLSFTNATGTNLQVANASSTNFSATGTSVITNLYGTLATFTSVTTTNFVSTNASTSNLLVTLATITNSTSTNLFSALLNALNASIDNLIFKNATGVNATTSNFATKNLTATGTVNFLGQTNLASVTISGPLEILSTATITGDLIPSATGTYSLGSLYRPWKDLFVSSSSVYIGGTKISNVNGVLSWGGSGINFASSTPNSTSTFGAISASSSNILNSTSTNLFSGNASITNATTTNLFTNLFRAFNAQIDNLTSFAINTGTLNATSSVNTLVLNASTTNATTSNAVTFNGTIGNIGSLFSQNIFASTSNATTTKTDNLHLGSLAVANLAGGGQIGTAANTVDILSVFNVNQTTTGQALTIPNLTIATNLGKIIYVNNVGTVAFKVGAEKILIGEGRQFVWTGSWSPIVANVASAGTNSYFILKGVNQPTTLTTLQNDNQLTFPIAANEKWFVQVHYEIHSSSASANTLAGFNNSAGGPTCSYSVLNNANVKSTVTCGTSLTTGTPAGNNDTGSISGIFTSGNTGGNISFAFARDGGVVTDIVTNQADSQLTAFRIDGADLAEVYFSKDVSVGEGDVVTLDGSGVSQVAKSSREYQKNVIGIVSTKPGLVIGEADGNGKAVVVGLSGRVPVKVSSENGNIKAGDFLTTSNIPGVAMRATEAGQVIGQALTDYSENDTTKVGTVFAFIKNTYSDGTTSTDTAVSIADKFTQLIKNTLEKLTGVMLNMTLVVSELKSNILTTNKIVTQEFCVGQTCFTEGEMKEFRNFLDSKKLEQNPAPTIIPVIPVVDTSTTTTTSDIVPVTDTSTASTTNR